MLYISTGKHLILSVLYDLHIVCIMTDIYVYNVYKVLQKNYSDKKPYVNHNKSLYTLRN